MNEKMMMNKTIQRRGNTNEKSIRSICSPCGNNIRPRNNNNNGSTIASSKMAVSSMILLLCFSSSMFSVLFVNAFAINTGQRARIPSSLSSSMPSTIDPTNNSVNGESSSSNSISIFPTPTASSSSSNFTITSSAVATEAVVQATDEEPASAVVAAAVKKQQEEEKTSPASSDINNDDVLVLSNKVAVRMSMVFAFASGVINCACFSGFLGTGLKQGIAGVTGTWTNSAIGAVTGNWQHFLWNTKLFTTYMLGSCIASLITPRPKLMEVNVKRTVKMLLTTSTILSTAFVLANKSNVNYLFLCCLVNGMTNSFTSTLTANVCRTTHYTGITSDTGTFLGQMLRGNTQNVDRFKSNIKLASSFWFGGFASYGLIQKYGSVVLLLGGFIHLFIATNVLRMKQKARTELGRHAI